MCDRLLAMCWSLATLLAVCASQVMGADESPARPAGKEPADLRGELEKAGGQWHLDDGGRIERLALFAPAVATDRSLACLRRLDRLRELRIEDTEGSSAWVASIADLTQLESLTTYRSGIDDAALRKLNSLKKLRTLIVEVGNVTDAGLEHLLPLEALEELTLRSTPITNERLTILARLPRLKRLVVINTGITPEGIVALQDTRLEAFCWHDDRRSQREVLPFLRHLQHLRRLDLEMQAVGDADLEHLEAVGTLEELDLRRNGITDKGLAYLSGLKNLRTLDLSGNLLTDDGLANLAGLHELRTLDLGGHTMRIGDAGLKHLAGLVQLRRLNLCGLQATVAGLDHLRDLANLEFLDISGTPLRDAECIDLRQFPRLKEVTAYEFDASRFLVQEGCIVVTFD